MDNSNVNQTAGKSCGISRFWNGLILLIIGLVIGVCWGRYCWHRTSSVAVADAEAGGSPVLTAQPAAKTGVTSPQINAWDPLQQISAIQAEINQIFQRSFAQFRANAAPGAIEAKPGYSLSMDVRDLKDRYQVRAFLPDTKASDVKVKLDGDQLKVDVANQTSEKQVTENSETAMNEWGHYEEVVRLAGPLKDNQMKVQRMEHELIISVPKA